MKGSRDINQPQHIVDLRRPKMRAGYFRSVCSFRAGIREGTLEVWPYSGIAELSEEAITKACQRICPSRRHYSRTPNGRNARSRL